MSLVNIADGSGEKKKQWNYRKSKDKDDREKKKEKLKKFSYMVITLHSIWSAEKEEDHFITIKKSNLFS